MKLVIEKNPEKRISEKNSVYHQSSQPLYRVKVLLKNLMTEPELYVSRIEKKVYKVDKLIDFLKNFEKMRSLVKIHAGAVVDKNGKGIILGALQDVGKTTLSLLLVKDGYSIIGDDMVVVSKDGNMYRLQEWAGIFPHRDNLKGLSISWKDRVVAWFKYHFVVRFTFLHQFIYPNLRVGYNKIGRVVDGNSIDKIFILERGEPSICKTDLKTVVNKILISSLETLQLPAHGFPKSIFNFYCFANNIPMTIVADRYKKVLESAFKDKEYFLIRGRNPFDFYRLFYE